MKTPKTSQHKKLNLIVALIDQGLSNSEIKQEMKNILDITPSHDYVPSVRRAYASIGNKRDLPALKDALALAHTKKKVEPESPSPAPAADLFSNLPNPDSPIKDLGFTVGDALFLKFVHDLRALCDDYISIYLGGK